MASNNLRTVPGVTGGNSRESRVRNFINRMPAEAARLVLSAEREDAKPLVLMEWSKEQCHEDLAPQVLQTLQDHMEDVEEPEVVGTLAWVDVGGRVLASMVLKDRARDLAAELTNDPMRLGTSTKDQLAQQMAQNERMHRLYIAGQATLQANQLAFVDRATGFNDRLLRRLSAMEDKLVEKEAELEAMAAMVRQYAAAAEQAVSESGDETSGLKKGIEILTQLWPMLQAARAPRELPRQTPPASDPPQTDSPSG